MNSIKGPAIFLAQFVREKSPFHSLPEIAAWAKKLGYAGIQVPAWEDPRFINLRHAAESKSYCDDWRGRLDAIGIEPTELNASLAGQVMAIHPAYVTAFQAFYPKGLIFSLLTEIGYRGWAVLEWECCIKSPEQGAREGAPFISEQIIEPTEVTFDDFAGGGGDRRLNRKILGLDQDGED